MAPQEDYLPIDMDGIDIHGTIDRYFNLGFTQLEILTFLFMYHNMNMSIRTLQRILRSKGLRRHGNPGDIHSIVNEVEDVLHSDVGMNLGYRAVHQRITVRREIPTSRETVRQILGFIDPEGVQLRRKRRLRRREYRVKGPNYLWHIDGWDKLKPFGLCVHGCIDGYSRRILWLEVAATNNDPYVICGYFATYCKSVQGIPHIIRADRGTENVNIEIMQNVLRTLNDNDPGDMQPTFLYGKSTSNQRIEAWWSKFKQLGMQTWIEHFKDLCDTGVIDTSSALDIQCVRYCFIALLSRELDTIRQLWNIHHIRKSRVSSSPSGKPDIMYYMPQAYDTCDYLKPFVADDMEYVEDLLCKEAPSCEANFEELFSILLEEGNKRMPESLEEADNLLIYLLDAAEYEINHA